MTVESYRIVRVMSESGDYWWDVSEDIASGAMVQAWEVGTEGKRRCSTEWNLTNEQARALGKALLEIAGEEEGE